MTGGPIDSERQALRDFLSEMTCCPAYKFNIISFGYDFQLMFEGNEDGEIVVPATETMLDEATQRVLSFGADFGGTELLSTMEFLEQHPPKDGVSRSCILLTDGGVSNLDRVVAAVERMSSSTRFFTFGLGDSVSTALVELVAEAGGGAAEFATHGERLVEQVRRQVRRLLQPAFSGVRVEWPDEDSGLHNTELLNAHVQVAPRNPRPVFDNEPYLVAALFKPPGNGTDDSSEENGGADDGDPTGELLPFPRTAILRGRRADGRVERWSVNLADAPLVKGSSIHKMVRRVADETGGRAMLCSRSGLV